MAAIQGTRSARCAPLAPTRADRPHLGVFDELDATARDLVAARLRRRSYRRGQYVFHDGDVADCLHVVQRGHVDVEVTTPAGHTVSLVVVHPGDMFGELALIHPSRRRLGSARALEAVETLALHHRDFDQLRAEHRDIDRLLTEMLTDRLYATSALVARLLTPPDARLWHELALLAAAYGDDPIRMSQDELAQTCATGRQIANRVLSDGVRRGILVVGRCSIRIVDRASVEQMAIASG